MLDLLGKYPFFTSIHTSSSEMYTPYLLTKYGIELQSSIDMEPGSVRYRLLRKINGYLISMPIPEEIKAEYDLESVSIPDRALPFTRSIAEIRRKMRSYGNTSTSADRLHERHCALKRSKTRLHRGEVCSFIALQPGMISLSDLRADPPGIPCGRRRGRLSLNDY